MKTKNLNYLRSYRLRWGLSQGELAYLLGWSRSEVISRIEMKLRAPTLNLVIACFVLFGTPPAELFPDLSAGIEAEVMARVWEFYEKLQGNPSKKTKKSESSYSNMQSRGPSKGKSSLMYDIATRGRTGSRDLSSDKWFRIYLIQRMGCAN